jgi:hypothetical protein
MRTFPRRKFLQIEKIRSAIRQYLTNDQARVILRIVEDWFVSLSTLLGAFAIVRFFVRWIIASILSMLWIAAIIRPPTARIVADTRSMLGDGIAGSCPKIIIGYAACHVPVVCGGRPSPPWPISLEYINRFPAKLAMVFRNRPLSSSLRSLNRNACSSKYRKR